MLQKGDISAQLDSKASPMVLLKETWQTLLWFITSFAL